MFYNFLSLGYLLPALEYASNSIQKNPFFLQIKGFGGKIKQISLTRRLITCPSLT